MVNMGRAVRNDYDDDPGRFATNQAVTSRFLLGDDVHVEVARRLAGLGCRRVVDIGGGNGTLARLLARHPIQAVVVDRAAHVGEAPRPAVRADARALPFNDGCFDGAAALWMLYHLADPAAALAEAYRVLRPGGVLAVCAPSRRNDPEFADVLPGWGEPSSFDAENGPELVSGLFCDLKLERWDAPLVRLPDRAAVAMFLRGRGLPEVVAEQASVRYRTPMTVTKRGVLAWGRRPPD